MWSVNDRVLGQRSEERYWYPGTIKHSDGSCRFFVLSSTTAKMPC